MNTEVPEVPYIIRPRQVQRMIAGAFSALALIVAVPAAAHAAACPRGATTHPFAAEGDNAAYSLLPGSSFEAGAPGWALTDAEVDLQETTDNGEYGGDNSEGGQSQGAGEGHAHYLRVKPHGVAVSPAFCVSSEYPSFRLYYKKMRGAEEATLDIALRWTDSSGQHEVSADSLQGSHSWTLSPILDLASRLPLSAPGSSVTAQFVFTGSGRSSWAIDDVYVDPYSR